MPISSSKGKRNANSPFCRPLLVKSKNPKTHLRPRQPHRRAHRLRGVLGPAHGDQEREFLEQREERKQRKRKREREEEEEEQRFGPWRPDAQKEKKSKPSLSPSLIGHRHRDPQEPLDRRVPSSAPPREPRARALQGERRKRRRTFFFVFPFLFFFSTL